jgi:acetolactate synthase-1/2/3 large subunit
MDGDVDGDRRDRRPASQFVATATDRHRTAHERPAATTAPFAPQDAIEALDEWLPDDVVVTCDAGENRLFMMRWYRTKAGGEYLQPASGGGMGHAVPAALGARLADPSRTAVAVCGDGGFAMSIHGLMTAVEQELPIGVVVLNNGALGWVLHGMGERAVASRFAAFEHAAIARAIGCEAYQPSDVGELRDALERVSKATTPVVIDVVTSLDTSFKDILDPLDRRRASSGY